MIRLLHGTHFQFIRWWKWAVALTAAFIVIGLIALAINGIKYSVEFTGGTLMRLEFAKAVDVASLRSALAGGGVRGVEIQQFGTDREFTVRAQEAEGAGGRNAGAESVAKHVQNVLATKYGPGQVTIVRTEAVGPRVGEELRRDAVIAMLLSFLVTTIYLAMRFEWRFGVAALIATSHDVLATIAFIAIMQLEVSLTVVAAILTVIGYSLNDTIIIFDRVRENLKKGRKETLHATVDRSINETLPRSILTHATTLGATMALLFFAGDVIRPFAWVMAFGIFTGTFSSVYVAGAVLIWIEKKWPRKTSVSQASSTATRTSQTRRSPVTATR